MEQLEQLSGLQIGELVNSGELSPVEVIQYFQDRIETRNDSINAFVYTKFDEAIEEAKQLEQKLQAITPLERRISYPFAGVPIGLKDFLPSKKGWTNSHGGVAALIREDDADSQFYKAAHSMGAIAIGKTNAPPFGFKGTCDNTLYGPTKNPFNTKYNSGGSSGGTAAAVADGLIPFGEGGDAGGSIRIPASWCNCFGFKASVGTIPSVCRPDAWAATHPFCCNGAITRTVRDSVAMLMGMAEHDPRDPYSIRTHTASWLDDVEWGVASMRIGVTSDLGLFPTDPDIATRVDVAAIDLEKTAKARVDIVIPHFKHSLKEFAEAWCWTISIDTALDLDQWKHQGLDLVRNHRDQLTEEFIHWNDFASKATIFDMRKFNEIRTDVLDTFEHMFKYFDVICAPVTCCPPLTNESNGHATGIGLDPSIDFIGFGETFLVNFVGYPAASVPIGLVNGMPVGMQIIGKKYHDLDVLRVARTIEKISPWAKYYDLTNDRLR